MQNQIAVADLESGQDHSVTDRHEGREINGYSARQLFFAAFGAMLRIASVVCLLFPGTMAANAQTVGVCESSLVSRVLPELSQDAFVSYANGTIRIAEVYVDGNLASNVVVVVLHPQLSDLQGAGHYEACTIVYSTRTRSPYFGQVFLRRAMSSYDPAIGLTLTIPVRYDYSDQDSEEGTLTLVINQANGEVISKEQ